MSGQETHERHTSNETPEELNKLLAPKKSRFQDAVLFGKVLSIGLSLAGYTFLGVYAGKWLDRHHYPEWLSAVAMPAFLLLGLVQGWQLLKNIVAGSGQSKNRNR